ncbi:carbohydrate ABC transporter permease [Tengunoibacter tsumagoiensis]|uniref:ABC transporter permease n=1 Tax=Tengunoibacter tsumagoiensis TaxID=2014871 RepID=A0A402A6W5_9CHLR|nr:carbohydrate ABC transporter permease [Tengunoibacter tsumagoiensis]GCE14887.1 ABC transporter permease [Tengunoibacter tsumagoiensis]
MLTTHTREAATTLQRPPMPKDGRQRKKLRFDPGLFATYIILFVGAFIFLAPFVWLISASLKDDAQFNLVPIKWIPDPIVWSNFVRAFTEFHLDLYLMNSLWLAAFSVVVNIVVCSLIAYGFARFHFPGRNILFFLLLSTMMFPAQVLTIPLFSVFRQLGWLGTFLPILVPKLFGLGATYEIFLFRQFFITLPKEIDEAAQLDGASTFGVYWRIILPMAKPTIIVTAVFSFLDSWKDAWGPLVYLNDNSLRTLPVGLLFFVRNLDDIAYPELMAATLIALAIPTIFYLFGQRYIDKGVVITSSK